MALYREFITGIDGEQIKTTLSSAMSKLGITATETSEAFYNLSKAFSYLNTKKPKLMTEKEFMKKYSEKRSFKQRIKSWFFKIET